MEVLTFLEYYCPGYKGGGPIKTVRTMVDQLGDEFRFKIVTRDRDAGDDCPYPNVRVNAWQTVDGCDVFYASPDRLSLAGIQAIASATSYDAIYLNSFFNPRFTILPLLARKLRRLAPVPVVIAPRGELCAKRLKMKRLKKSLYLRLANATGLYADVIWQASSEVEEADIRKNMRWRFPLRHDKQAVCVVPNTVPLRAGCSQVASKPKEPGSLKIIFLSRISPEKNLDYALDLVRDLSGDILFDIYGPVDRDKAYWQRCQTLMAELPDNIRAVYHGPIAPDQVPAAFAEHDVFLFPTRGENFGHVIVESFSSGTPTLLSDLTPWRNLKAKNAGWDIPLDRPDEYRRVLQQLVATDQSEMAQFRLGAAELAEAVMRDTNTETRNRELFRRAAA